MLQAEPISSDATPWDPVQRTMFIEWFPKWSGNVEKLTTVLNACNDSSLRSGFSLALGSIPQVEADAKKAWEPVFANWFMHQPDSGVHSAAGWAMCSWGLSPSSMANIDDAREGLVGAVPRRGLH